MIVRTRGYLPHFEIPESTYFVTFRLDDSLPLSVVHQWKTELQQKLASHSGDPFLFKDEYQIRVNQYLDSFHGKCILKIPQNASIVDSAIRYFRNQRYVLHAWTIMPNHVHVLFTVFESFCLDKILHSWKSFTANEINKAMNTSGTLWHREYFDVIMRSQRQFDFVARYILNNPVKAKLREKFYQWPWTGFSEEVGEMMRRCYRD